VCVFVSLFQLVCETDCCACSVESPAVLQHVLWLLECAAGGLLPAAVCSASWQVAAAACIEACTAALSCLDMLPMFADRCVILGSFLMGLFLCRCPAAV
jgi:hypothetical protein